MMLDPHFTNLIAINDLARVTLIAPVSNLISLFFGVRGEDFAEIIANWYTEQGKNFWENVGFYDELKSRGFYPESFR